MNPTQPPGKPAAAASGTANETKPGEVRIRRITFVTKGLPLAGVNSNVDSLQARGPDVQSGVDIVWLRDDRHYRISRWVNNELATEVEVHESRIEFRERM